MGVVSKISSLRKEGRLDEALQMARREISLSYDEWTAMSLFWVLRDYIQNVYVPAGDFASARQALGEMGRLLPNMMDEQGFGKSAYDKVRKLVQPQYAAMKELSELSKTNASLAYERVLQTFGPNGVDVAFHEDYGWIIYRYLKECLESLDSVRVRELLRDYICLKNIRPSLLHSMILNFAISFAKDHRDFNFYNFFELWGIDNLREEDFIESRYNGNKVPSLVSRVCRAIVDSRVDFDARDFVSGFNSDEVDDVIEDLRQACFWNLIAKVKENDKKEAAYPDFAEYAKRYSALGPSEWHSKILDLACRTLDNDKDHFIVFMREWYGNGNFRSQDWSKEKGEDGTEYPSLAAKSAKKSFEYVKSNHASRDLQELTGWLQTVYSEVVSHTRDDDWAMRNYAMLCLWSGLEEKAVSAYRHLLAEMGDKYYLWSETADCVHDNELRLGLLLKAKSLEKNEDFLGDIHIALAQAMISEGFHIDAQRELDTYVKHRQEKGWRIPEEYNVLASSIDSSLQTRVDVPSYVAKAEEFAYSDFECRNYVLTEKWEVDKLEFCSFYDGDSTVFKVKAKKFRDLHKSKTGQIFVVRVKKVGAGIVPLTLKRTDLPAWSLLKEEYGVVDYVNEQKHVLHIITADSKELFCPYSKDDIGKDAYVKFAKYLKEVKNEMRTCLINLSLCSKEEALLHMKSRIVVVDNVNENKQLFHVVLGKGLVSEVVRYDQTDLRPEVGDFLHLTYCVRKDRDGKKHLKILDVKRSDVPQEGLTKTVNGLLEVRYKNSCRDFDDDHAGQLPDFAFIDDYYVHRNVLKEYGIYQDCKVVADLVMDGDGKWKVYRIAVEES